MEHDILERILARSEDASALPLQILKSITDEFSEQRIIGRGGFGVVYKGVLPNNGGFVAVKRIESTSLTIDDNLFRREVRNLLNIDHRNVVRFLGFCSEARDDILREQDNFFQNRERLLCFEYISHGNLSQHMADELRGLEWHTRYDIIRGICDGLQYLHKEKRIKHMDLKPANIMLDNDMVPKITDFGVSRADDKSRTAQIIMTRGYCAPEHGNGGLISFECDIYSLGVIIIELVTGRMDIVPHKNNVLRKWKCRWNESVRQTSLQSLQVTKCLEIAEICKQIEPKRRPSIRDVIHDLNAIGDTSGHLFPVEQTTSLSSDMDDMLRIKPVELRLSFALNEEISTTEIELANVTDSCIAFHIKTVNQVVQSCCIEPAKGIVEPRSKRTVKITLQAQQNPTHYDVQGPAVEFIVRSRKVMDGIKDEDITEHMFDYKAAGELVDEVPVNLTVVSKFCVKKNDDDIPSSSSPQDEGGVQHSSTTRLNFNPPQMFISDDATSHAVSYDSYPSRESARAVDLMTGAMGSLLPKLRQLLLRQQEHNLQASVQKDIESLERQLKSMHAALCSVAAAQPDQLDPQDKNWANEVRELSYDIEDDVDDLLLRLCIDDDKQHLASAKQSVFLGLIHKMLDLIRCGMNRHQGPDRHHIDIAKAITDIKVRVTDQVADMRDRNWVGNYVANNNTNKDARAADPRLLFLYNSHKNLVGINGPRDQIAKKLTCTGVVKDTMQLKIISIYGPGGIGKTTLAKTVYDKLHQKFRLKAFVSVGRNPDTKVVLRAILYKLNKDKYERIHNLTNWDEQLLIDELHCALANDRYLIVIDDIWDIVSWEIIKCALKDNNKGSRIITTTRIFHAARNSGEVCKLDPLSEDDSKKLFYARLLGGNKDACNFNQPDEQLSTKILKKCGGVPLAIITIASLLASKRSGDWPRVCSSIGFGNQGNVDVDNTRKILLYSYHDLPCYLKTCLLYLATFPEDHEIEKDTLVWKWVAEGFVHEEPGEVLFKVGERYFNQLINRSMIQPVVEGDDRYTIYACRVHDMVLDIIRSVAKEENFVTVLDSDDNRNNLSCERNVRRLAVHDRVVEQHDLGNTSSCKPKVRSFNATRCRLGTMQLLPSFKVLRLLSLEDCTIFTKEEEKAQPHIRLFHLFRISPV